MDKKIFLLIILTAIFYLLALNSHLSTSGDNALFISLSKSLVENHEYSFSHNPNPTPETHWPFIFPLLLAPIIYFFGINVIALKLITVLFAILSIIIFYFILKEREDDKTTLTILMLTALNPLIFLFSHDILSEIPYLFFSLCALYFVIQYSKKSHAINKYLFLTSVFLILAYFTRPIGIFLIGTIIVYYIIKIRHKQDRILNIKKLLSIIALIIIPIVYWIVRTVRYQTKSAIENSLSQAFYINPRNPELGIIGATTFIERLLGNIKYYLGYGIIADINKVVSINLDKLLILILMFGLIFWIIAGFGFVKKCKQHKGILEYYFLIYLLAIISYPWSTLRFLAPVTPLFIYYFVIGAREFTDKLNIKKLFTIVILSLVLISAVASGFELKRQHEVPFYKGDWGDFYEASLWIKDNTDEESVVMSKRDALVNIWAERKSTYYPYTSNQTEIFSTIKKNNVDYIIVDSFKWTDVTQNFLIPFVEQNKKNLQEVHKINNTTIYKVISYSYQQENQI